MAKKKQKENPEENESPGTDLEKRDEAGPPTKYGDLFEDFSEEEVADLEKTTGAEDKPESDRRPPLYVYNIDTIDETGQEIDPGRFYCAQSGEQFDEVNCALIGFREIRQHDSRDEQGKQMIHCRSFDRKIGINQESGESVRCEECPHYFGKRGQRKDCTFHMRFLAWDFDRQQFFSFSAKRTGYVPTNSYLERTFFGQWKKEGKRRDIPLYMLGTKITLKTEIGHGSKYYIPVYECTGPNPKEIVMDLIGTAESFKKMTVQQFTELDKEEPKGQETDDDVPF